MFPIKFRPFNKMIKEKIYPKQEKNPIGDTVIFLSSIGPDPFSISLPVRLANMSTSACQRPTAPWMSTLRPSYLESTCEPYIGQGEALKTLPHSTFPHETCSYQYFTPGASLVVQWLRICLPMQGTRVRALVWEDPTCRRATGPVSHNYWACASGACALQQERPR